MHACEEEESLVLIQHGIEADTTNYYYKLRLTKFLDWNKVSAKGKDFNEKQKWFIRKAKEDPRWLEFVLQNYAIFFKEKAKKEKLSGGTVRNYFKPIWLLLELNRIAADKKGIKRILPKERGHADDRAPTIVEINKLFEYPDRRIKPAALVMLSSGIRVGSWDYLQWKHVNPIEIQAEIVAAKLTVFDTKNDEWYFTFITPEAYYAVKTYIDWRAASGEQITPESWVLRNKFDTNGGLASKPKKLTSGALKNLLCRALKKQGIRKDLPDGKHRYEFQADHGFRKFFETNCKQAGMTEGDVEWLMNHHDSYHRPTEQQLLDSYLQAIQKLTISVQVKAIEQLSKIGDLEEARKNDKAAIAELHKRIVVLEKNNEIMEKWHREETNLIKGFIAERVQFDIIDEHEFLKQHPEFAQAMALLKEGKAVVEINDNAINVRLKDE